MNTGVVDSRFRMRGRRGAAYVLILMTAMIATTLGVSGLYASRVRSRTAGVSAELVQARLNALAGLDHGLLIIQQNPSTWRSVLASNGGRPIDGIALGGGTVTLLAEDLVDGDLETGADPVRLTGTGTVGRAVYRLRVDLDGRGLVVAGSYRRAVD